MFLELGKNKFRIELWGHNVIVFQMLEIDINLLKALKNDFEATNGIEISWNTSGEQTTHMVSNFKNIRAIERIHIQTFGSEDFWNKKERENFVSSVYVNNPTKEIQRIVNALTEWVELYEIKNQKKSRLCKEKNKPIKQSLLRQIILPKDRRT